MEGLPGTAEAAEAAASGTPASMSSPRAKVSS